MKKLLKTLLASILCTSLVHADVLVSPMIVNGIATTPSGANSASVATVGYVQSIASSSVAGVATFNGRAGAVTQTSADITGALGYTPAQSGVVAIGSGGTGSTTASAARTALGLATVAATGAYADLSGTPTLGTAASQNTTAFDPAGAAAAITTITGNAGTATALAANPADCATGQFANAIAANGDLTCATPSTGGAITLGNLLVNSGAMVKQRIVAPTISATYQIGQVANMAAKVSSGTPVAGTITQVTNSLAGQTGYAMQATGVTVATASTIVGAMRMESLDAVKYKNMTISVSASVAQNTGATAVCNIVLNKASAVDTWTTEVLIATGTNTNVPTGTATTVKLENVAVGDSTNGLEIEVQCTNAAAITTKNFDFTEFQLAQGTTAPTYIPKDIVGETERSLRYAQIWVAGNTTSGLGFGSSYSTQAAYYALPFKVPMRVTPTGISLSSTSHVTALNGATAASVASSVTYNANTSINTLYLSVTVASGFTVGQGTNCYLNTTGAWLLATGAELF